MQQPEIRPAVVSDAEAGAWCHRQCWLEAYGELVDAAKLAERTADIDGRIERWARQLGEGSRRWIALNPDPAAPVHERVVGFIGIGPGRDEDSPAPVEVEAIYTRKPWWGSGLGSRLMEIAIGNQPATLWVLENNERAKTFYRRKGFVEDGAVADQPFFDVAEIRMVRT